MSTEKPSSKATDHDGPDKPVQPRDASSLLVYRGSGDQAEVLLGRRPKGSRFMPDVFVYPGGAVDDGDADIVPASALSETIVSRLNASCEAVTPTTLAMTAVRETFEETGLILASQGDPGESADPTWTTFRDRGLAPSLAPLRYIGRAVTPTYRPRRFHARFFAVNVDQLSGSASATDELVELDWFVARRTGDLPMADVTRFMLEQLLDMLEAGSDWIGATMFTHRDGRRHVEQDR